MRARWLIGLLLVARASAAEFVYVAPPQAGRFVCGAPGEGWQGNDFDDRAWSSGPVDAGVCAGPRFARYVFDVGAELPKLATLTLRVRYRHGFAAWLNGEELARKRLPPAAPPDALSTDVHGLEAESVVIALKPGQLRKRGNVLAVEAHPHTAGLESLLEVGLAGADGPRLTRGPYLERLSEHEVTLVLDTDLPTTAEAQWGPTIAYGSTLSDAPAQRHHVLRLTGLAGGTVYHYRVLAHTPPAQKGEHAVLPPDQRVTTPDAAFHTPPPAGKPLRFVVYGDVRSDHEVHARLNRAIAAEDPDFALFTGDMVDGGADESQWERFFEVAAGLLKQVAIFPIAGNHDYARPGRGLGPFVAAFRAPLRPGEDDGSYYSFDLAGVHFVGLDSGQYEVPRQLAWFENDLKEAEKHKPRAIYVFSHEPPYSAGSHGDSQVAIHDYVPIMERHHVTMFFGGHDHDYERGRAGTLDYVVTGGGGAELRAPRCGVPGKPACPPRVSAFFNEHNYVLVEVLADLYRVCAKRPDGGPLEPCVTLPLRR
jgi:hypothetical protein